MEEKYVVVYNREEIGKDTVKFVNRTRDTAKPFSYTREEVEMLVGYGYALIGHQLWYERHNKYSIGDLFVQSDGKQFVILDVRFPNGIGGEFYYDTHYVENDKLVDIGQIGGMWGECVINLAKFVGMRTDLLPRAKVKPTPIDTISLFEDTEQEFMTDEDDCDEFGNKNELS
jgi:hypothetical protein